MTPNLHTLLNQCHFLFPDPIQADPNGTGLIAVGADLSPATLITAYSQGLFPWFNENEPIAWWCPEPRCIINPQEYKPSKSLSRQAKKEHWQITINQAFDDVIHACSLPRSYANDTWIHDEMIDAYNQLHQLGFAHSIEVWNNEQQLIGGLYGLKIGQSFFGESMFHRQTNASKIAFWALNHFCQQSQILMIDCQLVNPHLLSLGAIPIGRPQFLQRLKHLVQQPTHDWQLGQTYPLPVQKLIQT